jgi:hypothetical protein
MNIYLKILAIMVVLASVSCVVTDRFEGYAFPQAVQIVTPYGTGSGVVIEQGVLTAEHVLTPLGDEDYSVVAGKRSFVGNEYVYRGGFGIDDRAILKVQTGIPPAPVYCGPLKTGERVIHVGYPGTSQGKSIRSITYGRISNTDVGDQGEFSNTVGAVLGADAGSSGGPVFNKKGEVVGVVVAVGRHHYGSLWTTLIARPPPEACPKPVNYYPAISNEVP